ncbi:DUF4861 domain-containing protein [Flavobacterium sp. HJJ]|uniref:DUF4861 domain-containing protein n=1 Tax=Flavobacterium sp. HJJ TaxID=2783792 RepID=UPI00188BC209|nr:DUF4861 domain-containing protein [Flavobacterium sp. HJJ]MBF4470542.1 DUF4861 domain-containing protein [Flavobacterium sp. HJJ]
MKLNLKNSIFFIGILGLFSGFGSTAEFSRKIIIENTLPFDRTAEIISIDLHKNKVFALVKNYEDLLVKDEKGNLLVTQLIDLNLDGRPDELLFQATVAALSKTVYTVFTDADAAKNRPAPALTTYARFVPERIDDFAWENDKVAFRTYGPEAQRLVDEKKAGGTLSSGIDIWLKKVNYPIIDSWYAKNSTASGYYHIDHGEGYDPYHVGYSRGNGGTGIWEKDSLYTSKNFQKYKVIAKGPLRAVFELEYPEWSRYGVKETKRISLDLGSNFSKFENSISSAVKIPNYTLGITLHQEKGTVQIDAKKGIFRHWEPIDDSFIGEGILIDPKVVTKAFDYRTKAVDQSQILIVTNPVNNVSVYYAGFAWLKSGQVKSAEEWDALLEKQSKIIQNPLKVKL